MKHYCGVYKGGKKMLIGTAFERFFFDFHFGREKKKDLRLKCQNKEYAITIKKVKNGQRNKN